MPIIRRGDVPAQEEAGVRRQTLADGTLGAVSLTVLEVTVAPGSRLPMHIHPGHEECIVILEGALEWQLGDDKGAVAAGSTIIAPKGIKHTLVNATHSPARLIAIFPTTSMQRTLVEP
ncbi:MAG: cupin domain-containing protein [Chloroflexota bacterium]